MTLMYVLMGAAFAAILIPWLHDVGEAIIHEWRGS